MYAVIVPFSLYRNRFSGVNVMLLFVIAGTVVCFMSSKALLRLIFRLFNAASRCVMGFSAVVLLLDLWSRVSISQFYWLGVGGNCWGRGRKKLTV